MTCKSRCIKDLYLNKTEEKTYIDVVFHVPHSDVVEKGRFIQVHKRT